MYFMIGLDDPEVAGRVEEKHFGATNCHNNNQSWDLS